LDSKLKINIDFQYIWQNNLEYLEILNMQQEIWSTHLRHKIDGHTTFWNIILQIQWGHIKILVFGEVDQTVIIMYICQVCMAAFTTIMASVSLKKTISSQALNYIINWMH